MSRIDPCEVYNFLRKHYPDDYPAFVHVPNPLKNPHEMKHPERPKATIHESVKISAAHISSADLMQKISDYSHRKGFNISLEKEVTGYKRTHYSDDWDTHDLDDDEPSAHMTTYSTPIYGKVISCTISYQIDNPHYSSEMKQYENHLKNIEQQKKLYKLRKLKIAEAEQHNRELIDAAVKNDRERWSGAARYLLGKNPNFFAARKEQLLKELAEIEANENQENKEQS